MATHKVDKVMGLLTAPNELKADNGNLLRAENVVIRTPGVVEPRRGFGVNGNPGFDAGVSMTFTSTTSAIEAFAFWKGYLIGVNAAGQFSAGDYGILSSSVVTLPDTVVEVPRQRPVSSNGNLYAMSSSGIQYFESVPSDPKKAGFAQPPDLVVTMATDAAMSASGSWLPADSQVAYRVVFGYYDANKNFKLSAPSGRSVLANIKLTNCSIARLTASQTVTVTYTNHGFAVGDTFNMSPGNGAGAGLYATGDYTVASVVSADQFTYTGPVGNGAAITAAITGQIVSRGNRYVNMSIYPTGTELTTSYFYRVYRSDVSSSALIDPGDELYLVYEKQFTSSDISTRAVAYLDKTPIVTQAVPLYSNPNTGLGIGSAKTRPPLARDINNWGGRTWYANTEQPHSLTVKMLGVGAPDGIQSGDSIYYPGGKYTFGTPYASGTPSQNIAKNIELMVADFNRNQYLYSTISYDLSAYALGDAQVLLSRQLFSSGEFVWYASRPASWAPESAAAGSNLTALDVNVTAAPTTGGVQITVTTTGAHGCSTGDYVILASNEYFGFIDSMSCYAYAGIYKVTRVSNTVFTYIQTGISFTAAGGLLTGSATYNRLTPSSTGVSDNNRQVAGLYYSELNEPEAVPLLNYTIVGDSSQEIIRIFPQEDRLLVFKQDGLYVVTGSAPFRVDLMDQTCVLVAPDSVVSLNNQVYALTTKGVVRIDAGGVQVISKPIDNTIRQLLKSSNLVVLRQLTWAASYENEMEYILAVPDPSEPGPSFSKLQLIFNAATNSWTTWDLWASGGFVSPSMLSQGERLFLGSNRYNGSSNYVLWTERKEGSSTDYMDYVLPDKTVTSVSSDGTQLTLNNVTNLSVGDVVTQNSDTRIGIITAINGSVITISAQTYNFATTLLTPYVGISCSLQFVSAFADDPTSLKQFRDATAFFRSRKFYDANLSFLDAWSSTEQNVSLDFTDKTLSIDYNTTTRVPPWNKRVLVPKDKQTSSYLNVGFNMRQARAYFALNGYSLVYDIKTDRNSR